MSLINRYENPLLQQYYSEIVAKLPEYPDLRGIVVRLVQQLYKPGDRVLDAGAGRGDSSKPILESIPGIFIDLVDESKEMMDMTDAYLAAFQGRYAKIVEDASTYFDRCEPYQIIISEFTVHNFNQEGKKEFYKGVHKALRSGGSFLLLDKIQQDDQAEAQKLREEQMARYRDTEGPDALPSEVAAALIAHEDEDAQEEFRMIESSTLQALREVGFSSVEAIQRIKRDLAIRAVK